MADEANRTIPRLRLVDEQNHPRSFTEWRLDAKHAKARLTELANELRDRWDDWQVESGYSTWSECIEAELGLTANALRRRNAYAAKRSTMPNGTEDPLAPITKDSRKIFLGKIGVATTGLWKTVFTEVRGGGFGSPLTVGWEPNPAADLTGANDLDRAVLEATVKSLRRIDERLHQVIAEIESKLEHLTEVDAEP